VTLRQASGSVRATLPKDMADRLAWGPGTECWLLKPIAESFSRHTIRPVE
jgi:hypothetical protein